MVPANTPLMFLAGALMPMGSSLLPTARVEVEREAEAPIQKAPVQIGQGPLRSRANEGP